MPLGLIDVCHALLVKVAERGVPRLEQANGAILEAVAEGSRGYGMARKRCRSVCAPTDLESPPNTQCVSQGGLGAWQVLRERRLELQWAH